MTTPGIDHWSFVGYVLKLRTEEFEMAEITIGALKRIELFERLRRSDLDALADLFARADLAKGDEVFRQGQPGQKAYFVKSGEVLARHVDPQGQEQRATLGPESFFGRTSLLLGEPHDATVEATQDTVLLSLDREEFVQFLRTHPSALRALKLEGEVGKKLRAPRFDWQDDDEIVVINLHKHNIILGQQLFSPVLIALFGLACFGYGAVNLGTLLGKLALVVGVLIAVGGGGFSWYLIRDQLNDNYVVTNKRVVHEERHPFGREARAEAPLHAIQDIQQSKSGMLEQLYNFGDLIIETAGERVHVVFRQIKDPAGTREAIFEQIQRAQAWAKAEERAAILDTMRERFDTAAPAREAASQPSSPEKKGRFQLTVPPWVESALRPLRYFLPPMRYEEGDTITWRKHWVTLIGPLGLPTLLIAALTLVVIAVLTFAQGNQVLILLGYGIVMVFLFPWWLWRFDDWQNDIYQVTATRIIDVERKPFFLREERREASLGVIQDINLEIPGFVARVLNYGSVTIETAGVDPFTFDYVHDPHEVQAEIFRRVGAFRAQQRQQEADRRRSELLDWFTVYDQIRGPTPPAPQPPSPSQPQET
jgi:uncharacterized membrane protein YdbT with pleckstrin-like domain